MRIKNHIMAATLAVSAIGAQASETFEREKIDVNDPRIVEMCKKIQNKTEMLLDGKEICEYSVDNGKSWITTKGVAYGVAALLGLGASAYGMIRLRRRKKGDLELIKPDNIIGDAQQKANEKNKGEVTYTTFDPDNQDALLKRVSGFIQNRQYKPAETQLNMTLGSHPGRTDLHIKKLELYFAQGDTEQFEAKYDFIVNTIDPLQELIPQETYLLMKDWGREIDPENELYGKSKFNTLEESMAEEGFIEIPGTIFTFQLKMGSELSIGQSNGGLDYMEDYVNTVQTPEQTTMIVLDGVGSGEKGATKQFVQDIGQHLESLSLEEILSNETLTNNFPVNVGATVGKATIENNVLTVEKIGDIGVLVFDKEGNIKLKDISGGYIPDSWFGEAEEVDLIEGQDIVNELRNDGYIDIPDFRENMTKGEFMRAYGRYTKQIGVNTKNEKVIKYDYILDEDDLVLVATDGLFDNMSIDTIIASVKSKNPASSNILAILNHLHTLAQNNENSFGGTYKKDNIGLSIYRHSHMVSRTPEVTEELIAIIETDDSSSRTPVITPDFEEATIIQPEPVIRGEIDMTTVKEKLKSNTLASDAIDALISALPKEEKYKRIAFRQRQVATKYGFDISEDQEGSIKLSALKPDSIIYYLNDEGGVEQNTEYEFSRTISLTVMEGGYMEAVLTPDYQTVKILLVHPEVE